jgi:hypothetical protein
MQGSWPRLSQHACKDLSYTSGGACWTFFAKHTQAGKSATNRSNHREWLVLCSRNAVLQLSQPPCLQPDPTHLLQEQLGFGTLV